VAAAQSWSGAPEGESTPALEYRTLFAPELARALPPVPWVCQGLTMAPGRPTIVCGIGGVGKSWFAQSLMLAGAVDEPFLGRFVCKPKLRSVYVDYEQGERITSQRFQLLAGAMGVRSLAALERRVGYCERPIPSWAVEPKTRQKTVDGLCRYVDALKLDLMVVDSVRACSPGTEENSSAASSPMDLATMVSSKTGVCIAFLDHSGKPGKDGQDRGVHNQRGHSSKTDACQTQLMLFASKGKPTLVSCRRGQVAAQPDWPEDFAFRLESVNGGVLLVQARVEDCFEEDKRKRPDNRLMIQESVGRLPGRSANWLAGKLGFDDKTVRAHLQSMREEGLVYDEDGVWYPSE
jgi:hypothetical protein